MSSTVSTDLLTAMNGVTGTAATSSNGLTGNSAAQTQDRFLKLLTTQLQNQDPTNPMDNAALTSQIAQLSTVTGIEQLNTSMTNLMSSLQTGQTMQAASMIGHSVLAPGNAIALASSTTTVNGVPTTSSKAVFGVQLAGAADSVKITIRNASGAAIDSIDLGAQASGTVPIIWDGSTSAGAAAPDGQYTFDVAATAAGSAVTATKLAFGTVSSVSNGTSGVKLNVSNLGAIGMSDVVQIL